MFCTVVVVRLQMSKWFSAIGRTPGLRGPGLAEDSYDDDVCLSLLVATGLAGASSADAGRRPAEQRKAETRMLSVFAAASLTEPFTEIGRQFETANPCVKVQFNFAGSQQLAPVGARGSGDVFAGEHRGR